MDEALRQNVMVALSTGNCSRKIAEFRLDNAKQFATEGKHLSLGRNQNKDVQTAARGRLTNNKILRDVFISFAVPID